MPPILICHLKRFVYDAESGSVRKVTKPIDYPLHLSIPRSTTTGNSSSGARRQGGQRTYTLYAVIHHHGPLSSGGHYTAHVRHDGDGDGDQGLGPQWLDLDDSFVDPVPETVVLGEEGRRSAYLLFYQRD